MLLCLLASVCMLYVYGCFGEINYDDKAGRECVAALTEKTNDEACMTNAKSV